MIFVSSKISDGDMLSIENRKKFFKRLGINPKKVTEITQVHGNKIVVVDDIPSPIIEADSLVSNKKGVYLMIKIADCMAIGLYNPKHNVIGLIHVGWRGIENGVIKNTINLMKKNFKINSSDLFIKISPSIGPCHYRMDLWKEAENQLMKLGVSKKNIDNPRICTYESNEYFSHRRSEDQDTNDFRFATILGLGHAN